MRKAITLPSARFSSNAWAFIDNTNFARKLLTKTPSKSSQSIFLSLSEIAEAWKTRTRLPHTREVQINVRWVPSHAGIQGNKMADQLAKIGASIPYPDPHIHSFAALIRWNRQQLKQARSTWWNSDVPNSYARLEIKTAPHFPSELLLGRKALGHLIAARTGHGDFAAYHTRFNHNEARLNCLCGSPKTPTHFLFCRIL